MEVLLTSFVFPSFFPRPTAVQDKGLDPRLGPYKTSIHTNQPLLGEMACDCYNVKSTSYVQIYSHFKYIFVPVERIQIDAPSTTQTGT